MANADPAASSASEDEVGGGVVAERLRSAARMLADVSDTPRLDAELLMAHAFGLSRSELLLRQMGEVAPEGFAALLERRRKHEPVAYILGRQEFFGLELEVGPAVLIPRADSEVLVETALASRPDARDVLDCGTGSGALLLAVLSGLPAARGLGIDNSPAALDIARRNSTALGLDERTRFIVGDWNLPGWADKPEGGFDLVLANPPYVENDAELSHSVRHHEPHTALFAGADGLDAYRVLIPQLRQLLSPDGVAVIEIGASQAEAVSAIARHSALSVEMFRDLGRRPRVLRLTQLA